MPEAPGSGSAGVFQRIEPAGELCFPGFQIQCLHTDLRTGQVQNALAGLQRGAFGAAMQHPLPHDLILESRSRLTVTGVQRVLHCSAESAALETGKGILHLSGAQISMQTLDLEAGEAKLTGRFDGLEYTAARTAGSFWHRLLR